MTAAEFATRVLLVKTKLTAQIQTELPSECSLVDRYILSGVTSEEDWLTTLRGDDDKIRMMAILMTDLNLEPLGRTNAGQQFNPFVSFNLELYHEYKLGTDSVNTELNFISDASAVLFALGKSRKIMDDTTCIGVITKAGMRLGMRPSKLTTMHYGKGNVIVDMRDISYAGV